MSQPETRLQREIQKALKQRGAFVFKIHGSEYMVSGLPDLVVCYRGLFIGMEVKMPEGKQSERQRYIERQVIDAGGKCRVVRSVRAALKLLDECDEQTEIPKVVRRF